MSIIVSSTFTEGPVQPDGSRFVYERHVDDRNQQYVFEWQGTQVASLVLQARATQLELMIKSKREAEALIYGTKLPYTPLQFRDLFGTAKYAIDEFEVNFEAMDPATLGGVAVKRAIRTGFKDFNKAENIARPLLPPVIQMLQLFVNLNLMTAAQRDSVVAAANG